MAPTLSNRLCSSPSLTPTLSQRLCVGVPHLQVLAAAKDPERKPVKIFGEPGLEKDNIAALLHFGSPDRTKPMVKVGNRTPDSLSLCVCLFLDMIATAAKGRSVPASLAECLTCMRLDMFGCNLHSGLPARPRVVTTWDAGPTGAGCCAAT